MQIFIVEDELLIAEMLKEMLLDLGQDVVGIASNYYDAIQLLQKQKADLVFLDINLKDQKNGFDIAQFILDNLKIKILFLTSYSDKNTIASAMQYKPEAYLIKPFSETDLFATIELIKSKGKIETQDQYFVIKDGIENIKIAVKDVLYFKSNNIYVEVKTISKTHLIRTSIAKILEEISNSIFVRVHRTYAVNLSLVQAVASDYLLVQGEKIPLSRMHRDDLYEKFSQ